MAYVLIDGNTVFLSGAKSADEIYKYAIKTNGTIENKSGTLFYSDSNSFMYASTFDNNGKSFSVINEVQDSINKSDRIV